MIEVNGRFEDVHGISHADPVVVVNSLQYSANHRKNLAFVVENGNVKTVDQSDGMSESTVTLAFSAVLYVNKQAMINGKQPLRLRDKGMQEWFMLSLPSTLPESQWLAAAENHIQQHIIQPSLS